MAPLERRKAQRDQTRRVPCTHAEAAAGPGWRAMRLARLIGQILGAAFDDDAAKQQAYRKGDGE